MDDGPGLRGTRDDHGLSDTIFDMPSRGLDMSSADIRAASIPAKRAQEAKSKRKGTSDSDDYAQPTISLSRYNARGYWITTKPNKRNRLPAQKDCQMEMHQSTCLNLNINGPGNSTESDLWILPDFEEWELDREMSPQQPVRKEGEWAPLLARAVNSNRERLRRRLEGDGWDFIGGRYGEDGKIPHEFDAGSEESVDEEFDVVVLPLVSVSC